MTAGLIDDADFRIIWGAWRCLEARFHNNVLFRIMPALPTRGTGDALESMYTFYNKPREEDLTKRTVNLIRCIKRALRQRFTNRCWCEAHGVSQRCIIALMENKLVPKGAWSANKDSDDPCKDLRAQLIHSTYESLENLLPRKAVATETAPTRHSTEQHATKPLAVTTIAYIRESNQKNRICIEYMAF